MYLSDRFLVFWSSDLAWFAVSIIQGDVLSKILSEKENLALKYFEQSLSAVFLLEDFVLSFRNKKSMLKDIKKATTLCFDQPKCLTFCKQSIL